MCLYHLIKAYDMRMHEQSQYFYFASNCKKEKKKERQEHIKNLRSNIKSFYLTDLINANEFEKEKWSNLLKRTDNELFHITSPMYCTMSWKILWYHTSATSPLRRANHPSNCKSAASHPVENRWCGQQFVLYNFNISGNKSECKDSLCSSRLYY